MKIRYVVCASFVLVDRFSNGVSAINILDNIPVPSLPFWIPQVTCVGSVTRSENDPKVASGKMIVRLGDEVLAESPVQLDFQGDIHSHGIALGFQGLRIEKSGELQFRLEIDGVDPFTYSVDIILIPTHTKIIKETAPSSKNEDPAVNEVSIPT